MTTVGTPSAKPNGKRRARPNRATLRIVAALLLTACAHPGPGSLAADRARKPPVEVPRAASPRPVVSPGTELTRLDLSARLGEYQGRDAAWVPGLPLAVNRDFDFALALSIEGVGPGIAARKRRDANLEFAQRLSEVAAFDAQAQLEALCAASPRFACEHLAGEQVRIYGLLFGERDARLQVVLEIAPVAAERMLYIAVSEARPIAAFLEAGVLQQVFGHAAADLAGSLAESASPDTALSTCMVGGTAKLTGRRLVSRAGHALLLVEEPTARKVLCPHDAIETPLPTPDAAARPNRE